MMPPRREPKNFRLRSKRIKVQPRSEKRYGKSSTELDIKTVRIKSRKSRSTKKKRPERTCKRATRGKIFSRCKRGAYI
jgi:hypothetical protein